MKSVVRLSLCFLAASLAFFAACREKPPRTAAEMAFDPLAPEDVPNITFPPPVDRMDAVYLGLPGEGKFRLQDIAGEVVVIEFLNVHCKACQQQAPVLAKAFRKVEGRADLRPRIKFLAVTAGNNEAETKDYVKRYGILFPVLPDPFFAAYNTVGSPGGLPLLLMVTLRPQGGGWHVAKGHVGLVTDSDLLIKEAETAFTARADDISARTGKLHLGEWRDLTYNVSESFLKKMFTASAAEAGFSAAHVEPMAVAEGETVYRLESTGGRRLWAKLAGRSKICNICHDIFFIIMFDDAGKVLNYTSVYVTKGNNVKFDDVDNWFMRGRIVGRYLLGHNPFDAKADTITGATMSAALIFDTVRRLGDTFRAMKAKGLLESGKS